MKLTIFLFLPFALLARNCTKHEFSCDDGKCLPLYWKCDNVNDCQNGEDEQDCVHTSNCQPNSIECSDGLCVGGEFKCDNDNDCLDGADELYCAEYGTKHNLEQCLEPRMKCSSGQCIAENLICDGYKDCVDGDDEINCKEMRKNLKDTVIVSLDKNECRHGFSSCRTSTTCIPDEFICDGAADCEDSSDEKNCDSMGIPEEFDEESADIIVNCIISGQFRCQAEFGRIPKCIPMNATCNGIKDCPNGDDESSKCLDCTNRICDHWCNNTPNGAQCVCREGYILDHDGITCIDEDDCVLNGYKCQHFCQDLVGSYKCQCEIGYRIDDDGYGCRLEGDDFGGSILLSIGTEIRSTPLVSNQGGGSYSTIQRFHGHGTVRSIDFDQISGNIYLSIVHQQGHGVEGELAVFNNGVLKVIRENMAGIGYIAIDRLGANVFLTQKAPARHIGITVCKMNGMFCRWIIQGQEAPQNRDASALIMQNYRGLAVHSARGIVIWIDVLKGKHKIMMANMDGSQIRVLVDTKLYFPSALAIDHVRDDIYFSDVERGIIERINLNTRDRRVVISKGVFHPFDMKIFNGFLYWSDWGGEDLKAHKLTTEYLFPQIIHTFNRFPYGIAINHSMYSREVSHNPCEDIECHWICVLVEMDATIARCVCPDGYMEIDGGCVRLEEFANFDDGVSQIGMNLMKEYCDSGIGCWNGGSCREVMNEEGRSHRIECECLPGYGGLFCESRISEKNIGEKVEVTDWFLEICLIIFLVSIVLLLIHAIQIKRKIVGDTIICSRVDWLRVRMKTCIFYIQNIFNFNRNNSQLSSYRNPVYDFTESREVYASIWENGETARYLASSDSV